MANSFARGKPIPGISGKRVPGNARLPKLARVGGHLTNVPFQSSGSSVFREFHRQQVRDSRGRFGGGWGFAWQGLENIDANLVNWNEKLHADLHSAMDALKDEMVAYMKDNAPWQDETGNARAGLQGAVIWNDDEHFTILLGHGADIYYGIWLEVRWGGRYAIVLPTIERFMPEIPGRIKAMT